MITIIYSTHLTSEENNKFKQHLILSSGLNPKKIQILEFINHNEFSLSQVYNEGINKSIYDIVVCCHNDIKLENGWAKKLIKNFKNNPEYGIIGKAGSCYFPESGVYWEKMNLTMVGQVYHHPKGQKKWLSQYSAKLTELIPVVTIDGLFISFDKTKIKHTFDESIGKFHFYDHPFCLSNFLDGVKIGVTSSFDITHESIGQPNDEFYKSKEVFLEKYGKHLPIDLKPEKIYFNKIQEKKLKGKHKVAIVIPTKDYFELLKDCINSFYENCNENMFHIFIADTGSSEDNKNLLRDLIKEKNNITLLEYDYYNFGKINNDVVRNYIKDDFTHILFSNNDIKIMNNVIFGMLNFFESNRNIGTLGARLHFKDNTIQHLGISSWVQGSNFKISHIGLNSYYSVKNTSLRVIGNTAALLMIKKEIFNKIGGFNENYTDCLEDVELNFRCILIGLENYVLGDLVAYHYESQTRNLDPQKVFKFQEDYSKVLLPFVQENFESLKPYIQFIK
jgi:GT2 family glycosyltransferase